MISVDFVTCLICRQLLMQTKIPVQRHFHNWMTCLNSLRCVRAIGFTHVFSSRLQIIQSRMSLVQEKTVELAWRKKWIYKLNLHLFEMMVYLRFKKPWFWSYSHATSLSKSVGNHTFYAFLYLPLVCFGNFTVKTKLDITWNAKSVTNR